LTHTREYAWQVVDVGEAVPEKDDFDRLWTGARIGIGIGIRIRIGLGVSESWALIFGIAPAGSKEQADKKYRRYVSGPESCIQHSHIKLPRLI
jgi:hypothetical protein